MTAHAARTPLRSLPRLLVSLLPLVACRGLDPRKLERLEYGMEQKHVAKVLDEPLIPVVRFFAEDALGREQDVWIEVCEGHEGSANYALVSIDGRLSSVSIASGGISFLEGQWWRDEYSRGGEVLCPWWPRQLRALVQDADERALDLAWKQLEPIDHARRTSGRYTALGMGMFLVVPLVLYTPYYVWRELFDGRYDRAVEARAFLLAAPRETTVEQVVAKLGPAALDRAYEQEDKTQRVLTYELPGSFRFTIGFVDDRLLWADFGSWYDWSWAFANMGAR